MGTVADILKRKGSGVKTIRCDATALEAARAMVEHSVGSLLVEENGRLCGIVTERDYLRRVPLQGRRPEDTYVADIMTRKVVCVGPGEPLETCMAIMTERRFRHLPVMSGGELAGLVSIGDLVKHLTHEQQLQIKYLEDYIGGKYPG